MEHSRPYPAHVAIVSPAASQSSITTTATNTTTNRKRKSSTATGSRGVANLTPEQLAKKRANDREAQRAIRERTKGQIEQLERRIQQLTEQKPYQELQDVIRQKELVEAQNEEMRRRLTSVMTILQPICGLPMLGMDRTDGTRIQLRPVLLTRGFHRSFAASVCQSWCTESSLQP